MGVIAVVGNLSIDRVDGRPPSVGGGPYWAARGLHEVPMPTKVLARSGAQDRHFDPALLEYLTIIKLAEEEAEVIGDVASLGVPEIIVTLGERGALVIHDGVEQHVPTRPLDVANPTGAGDAFAMGYLAARSEGVDPVEAAARANAVAGA